MKRVLLFKNKSVRSEPLRNAEQHEEAIKPSKSGKIGAAATSHNVSTAGGRAPTVRLTAVHFGARGRS